MDASTDCPTLCRLYQNHQGHIRRCKYVHIYGRGVRACMSVYLERHIYIHTYIHTHTTHTCILHTYIYSTVGVARVTRRVTPSQRACRSRQQKKCSGRAAIWRQGSSHGGPSDQHLMRQILGKAAPPQGPAVVLVATPARVIGRGKRASERERERARACCRGRGQG